MLRVSGLLFIGQLGVLPIPFMTRARWISAACFTLLQPCLSQTAVSTSFQPSAESAELLEHYCFTCHDEETQKGDIRLDNIADLDLGKRLDLLNRMQEQLYFRHMPPKNKRQPDDAQRKELLAMFTKELIPHHASTLEDKLQKPEFGNYIDHQKLFSGEFATLPSYTPDRRWLISEYIFNAKFQRLLENTTMGQANGKRFAIVGSNRFQTVSLANPFLLPNISGVRYYANEDLTGGHLSSMLTNAQKTSEYITNELVKRKNGKYLPAITQIMALDDAQASTLASRRAVLQTSIAKLCSEIYGEKNESWLPTFLPVELKPIEASGETYKKAPIHVALNMIKDLQGAETLFQLLLDPEQSRKSDDELRVICEKTWFYNGDHERTIQGRMAILREYMPEMREHVDKERNKIKAPVIKPLSDTEMATVRSAIQKHRQKGDRYAAIVEKCMSAWEEEFAQERARAGPPADQLLTALTQQLFVQILERSPTAAEAEEYLQLSKSYVEKLGKLKAIQKLIQTVMLSTEFVYRQEFGAGPADEHGRRMLSPRDASYAIAYALTDQSPDAVLTEAANNGKLSTREDYKREVERILKQRDTRYLIDPILADKNYNDNTTALPIRKLRFFREFFGYPLAITIFKDEKRFGGDRLDDATCRLINEADRTVEHILNLDKHVFEELLTTEKFYLYHDGDNERMQAASDRIKSIYAYFKDLNWKKFTNEDLVKHAEFLRKVKMRSVDPDNLQARNRQGTTLQLFKLSMESITARLDKGQKEAAPFDLYRGYGYDFMVAYNVSKFYDIPMDNWHYETIQPARVPHRKGMLTHPAWLIANAKNTETDPIHRGKWVREKLLAGTVPDVPISVDAVIPEDHTKTLRDRLAGATEVAYCWKCHEGMNQLGYTFESYDDFGRFRVQESLEYPDQMVQNNPDKGTLLSDTRDLYKTLAVNPRGHLSGTGDLSLDGDVQDAIDLTTRLAKSRRVRQSIIRHAFRYFMGRNEFLSDSQTLINAEKAYAESGGSFDAVIISLLTSDSFLYRKPIEN
jgi:hypothetical protein